MKLSVIGYGYLRAVHASAMAELGYDVVGIDVDADKVAKLSMGRAPFFEPDLNEVPTSAVNSGRLRFSTDVADAAGAQVHFMRSAHLGSRAATQPISPASTPRWTPCFRTSPSAPS